MITEKEKLFMAYWEQEREARNTFANKLFSGLPVALLFGLPLIVIVFVIQYFFPQWYNRASQVTQQTENGQRIITKEFENNPEWYNKVTQFSTGTFMAIIIAVLIGVFVLSYLRMNYKWEANDQLYKELKAKQNKLNAASLPVNHS